METLERLKSIIRFTEASDKPRLEAYRAHKDDPWTIGYGHTKGVTEGMKITPEQAEEFMHKDLEEAYGHAKKMVLPIIWKKMTKNQKASLTDLVFNVGPGLPKIAPKAMRNLNAGNFGDFQTEAFDPIIGITKDKVDGKLEIKDGLVKRRSLDRSLWNLEDGK